ncbi:MAG: Sensor histidine kinase YehU [Candidatus Accumulibacter regalis]|jgi:Predicted signal transduction protein with a C-terminal ATPase domain|uniref:Sensor histidine kinase YehU n=1 Tax=Accumulibacter regalis TaxID=522306 RepID=A0A011P0D4_ACCRE|nr:MULTISPECIES: histidine kinase [unclassified Candidatus Accumulibacter]EXI88423.1 MAG: Sensor histidine kinase YehU [Candidatus Accumulibacter regalis]MBL8367789.1 histidine kinase [Accumulibacter sp.]MBN8513088.1 histidine kinase [Accumulibacter sp.]MBO3701739.1 histidine kinase [Accumulibacter sp.]HRE71078.1 histidine kinase [Accumulibacter sp.]
MASIKQNLAGQPLPDFRNSGVMLRILLGVNLLALGAALVQSQGVQDSVQHFIDMAAWVQPLLLFNLALLAILVNILRRAPAWIGRLTVLLLAVTSAMALSALWNHLLFADAGGQSLLRAGLLAGLAAGFMLAYFALRVGALSPALVEARLQALTARIRPHFLFNTLNAVLSLIRADPRRAETALEELAELFRALMRDHRELVPLADELALCRQYLDLEKLRLAERLHVEWDIAPDLPLDLKVPPLMVQPLLENAVYHGIEPLGDRGCIRIGIGRRADALQLDIVNPCAGGADNQHGSHMALANIRERLALYYDLEARLETDAVALADGRHEYRVRIVLPCREQGR